VAISSVTISSVTMSSVLENLVGAVTPPRHALGLMRHGRRSRYWRARNRKTMQVIAQVVAKRPRRAG
jgi:hypothetical protein